MPTSTEVLASRSFWAEPITITITTITLMTTDEAGTPARVTAWLNRHCGVERRQWTGSADRSRRLRYTSRRLRATNGLPVMLSRLAKIFSDSAGNTRSKIAGIYSVLLGANLLAWIWAFYRLP